MKTDNPSKQSLKTSWSSYIHIWQNRLEAKISQKRQRRSFHINIGKKIHQEEIIMINIYPNIGTTIFIKHTLLDIRVQIDPEHNNSV
jgi:hypothetical protein